MFKWILNHLKGAKTASNDYKIQSFTFFVPAPPKRSTGYREKQFDKLFYEFINRGYRILNFSTQSISGENNSGMWLIFIVQATNAEAEKLNLNDEFSASLLSKANVKEEIEGLYYIDDKAQEL